MCHRPYVLGSSREGSCLLFALALLGFIAVAASVMWRFASPRPDYVEVGPVAAFPPAAAPYSVMHDDLFFYLVNDGARLVALNPWYQRQAVVRWVDSYEQFIDPRTGTRFDRYGIVMVPFGATDHSLTRYPLQLEEGIIYVKPHHSRVEEGVELLLP
ncbi:MAG: hypothetical protein M3220_13445 [Chloroflexota bacterium]|nr:hypothetical protein [Chloroflexota bacterium]